MSFIDLTNSPIFLYIALPLLIFLSRIVDQSIGMLRIILATKGYRLLALIFGFCESIIWIVAISQIMKHLDNVFCYIAFASGYAVGNWVGITIENRLSIGFVIVRVVFDNNAAKSLEILKENGFGMTVVDANRLDEPVKMLFSTIKRSDLKKFITILNINNPKAFYTVEDVKKVKDGYFHRKKVIFDFIKVPK